MEENKNLQYLVILCSFRQISTSFAPILDEFLRQTVEKDGERTLYLNRPLRLEIAEKCGVKLPRLEQAITAFLKAKIMRKIGTGTFVFPFELFGRIDWDKAAVKCTISFENNEISAEIKRRKKKNTAKKGVEEPIPPADGQMSF